MITQKYTKIRSLKSHPFFRHAPEATSWSFRAPSVGQPGPPGAWGKKGEPGGHRDIGRWFMVGLDPIVWTLISLGMLNPENDASFWIMLIIHSAERPLLGLLPKCLASCPGERVPNLPVMAVGGFKSSSPRRSLGSLGSLGL